MLQYEFKTDLNAYLAGLGPNAPVKTLQDIIEFNERNRDKEMPFFGQETFLKAQEKGPLTDKAYVEALEKNHRLSRDEGIDAVMNEHKLDAIVSPTTGPARRRIWFTATATPAAAQRQRRWPVIRTSPFRRGTCLDCRWAFRSFGRAFSEPMLFKCAFAFEQATKARKAPRFLPTIG